MRVNREEILDKMVEKILHIMPIKFDHVVTIIIESHNINTMTIVKLRRSIESHVSRILKKTEKSTEKTLKSQVNLNKFAESSQDGEERGYGQGKGNVRDRGRENSRGRGCGNN